MAKTCGLKAQIHKPKPKPSSKNERNPNLKPKPKFDSSPFDTLTSRLKVETSGRLLRTTSCLATLQGKEKGRGKPRDALTYSPRRETARMELPRPMLRHRFLLDPAVQGVRRVARSTLARRSRPGLCSLLGDLLYYRRRPRLSFPTVIFHM